MRVLELIHGLTPGGAESGLVRRLAYQPDDVHTTVVCATPIPAFRRERLDDLGITSLEHVVGFGGARAWLQVMSQVRPDVIVSHSPRETLHLLRWNSHGALPLVVVAHHPAVTDDRRFSRVKEAAFRALNPRASMHVAVSQSVAAGPACRGARRVSVHLLGAELEAPVAGREPWPSGTRLRLLALSRLATWKNTPALVEAVGMIAPALRAAGAHLAVVGSGPAQDAVMSAVLRHDVTDLVSMHPQVSNPTWLLEQADVLVSSSTEEGGPLTLFEASLAGTRVMATPTGVAAEVIAVDSGSCLAEGSEPVHLARALTSVIAAGPVDADERVRRAAAGQRWHVSRRAPEFYDLMRSVAQVNAGPHP